MRNWLFSFTEVGKFNIMMLDLCSFAVFLFTAFGLPQVQATTMYTYMELRNLMIASGGVNEYY